MIIRPRSLPSLAVIATLVVILGATLFPFKFSWQNRRSLAKSFGLSVDIMPRGNDLLIGLDGGLGQAFKGRIDDLRIYRRARTPAEIAQEAHSRSNGADAPKEPQPDPDLVLSYGFDDDGEKSGDLVRDASGMGNHGRLVKAPRHVHGEYGEALRFSGAGEYVRVPNSPAIDIAGRQMTISMRVALEGPRQRFDQTIIAKPWHSNSSGYPWYQYAVEFDSGGNQSVDFYFADTSGRPRGPFQIRPPIGPWTHVAFTYDGSRVHGYVDGREELSSGLDPWQIGDIIRNILLFVPLGFSLAAVLGRKRYSAAAIVFAVVSAAFVFSFAIEITQSLLPNRNSSFVDVATNTIGGAAGAVCYLFARFLKGSPNDRSINC